MSEIKNRVQITGNLGRDPEIRTFDGNKKMARFSIATPEYTSNPMGGKIQQLQWHNAIAWGKTADLVEQQLFKGLHVAIEGKLSSKSYVAKDGTKKYSTDIVVHGFEILEQKK